MEDPESGEQYYVNTSTPNVHAAYNRARAEWQLKLDRQRKRFGIDKVEISTDPEVSYLPAIHSLFKKRESRRTA